MPDLSTGCLGCACRLLDFEVSWSCGGMGNGMGQIKMPPSCELFWSQLFLCVCATPPTESCQPLVNFQHSEMLILTIFARVLHASVEERIFGDPDSATF